MGRSRNCLRRPGLRNGRLGTITLDDVHQAITDRLGLDETVFLDDTGMCVAGAREAGIHAVHYRDSAQAIEEIEKLLPTP
jgi:hypothetical protein